MKKLLCSHVDLDGLGSVILQRSYADIIPFDKVITLDYGFEELPETRMLFEEYDEIVIVDLSCSSSFFQEIGNRRKIFIFDHHETSSWLKGYRGSCHDDTRCGTKIFYEEYLLPKLRRVSKTTEQFVNLVDTYDRWQIDSPYWEAALSLNRVMFSWANYNDRTISSHNAFIKTEAKKIREAPSWYWTDAERISIEQSREIEDRVYRQAKKDIKLRMDRRGCSFGILPMRSKISLTLSRLLRDDYPTLDYILVVNTFDAPPFKISLRSARGFDCTALAGTGGHKAAAGGTFTPEICSALLKEQVCLAYKDDPEWAPQILIEASLNSSATDTMTGAQRDLYVAQLRKEHPLLREHILVPVANLLT
jgi:oligoribonuclease NrnB/cAMP/cGMP phosphodiesterase (DHH superfamily)